MSIIINEYLSLFFSCSKKFRAKFVGRTDDADTDSGSDSDFLVGEDGQTSGPIDVEKQIRTERSNLELLEKR